jgi:two-component system, sensor histidine kinase PdtaS
MGTADNAVQVDQSRSANRDAAPLAQIARVLPVLADMSRADILLGALRDSEHIEIVAQARPHSVVPIHRESISGSELTRKEAGTLFRAITERQPVRTQREYTNPIVDHASNEGVLAPVVQEAFPIEKANGQMIGGLMIETNLLESERLKRRNEIFQRALKVFQQMALRGQPAGIENLSAFGEHDGIVFVDADGVIRYMSGIAVNLYRNIGYSEPLIGKSLSHLEMNDDELVSRAMEQRQCAQIETEERGRTWIKKTIPLVRWERGAIFSTARPQLFGAFLLIHDATESRQRQRELLVKATMIKEMHHRVKNDLQTVASLLRMQSRRMQTTEAKTALGEAVNRILSIAVIHEFLSEQDSRAINIRDVAQRIVTQMQAGILDPSRHFSMQLSGPNIYLPARQATSCALVLNELMQNALEHGYDARAQGGTITLTFHDHGDAVGIVVHDDGRELPPGFSLDKLDSLGLRIVQMLVTQDLKGQFDMHSDQGVSALVRFPKIPLGGDERWNEPE